MPDTTRRIPNHRRRAQRHDEALLEFRRLQKGCTQEENLKYIELLWEAGSPKSTTDRAAILERAKAHVANAALAERERGKPEDQIRKELWGS